MISQRRRAGCARFQSVPGTYLSTRWLPVKLKCCGDDAQYTHTTTSTHLAVRQQSRLGWQGPQCNFISGGLRQSQVRRTQRRSANLGPNGVKSKCERENRNLELMAKKPRPIRSALFMVSFGGAHPSPRYDC